jgi:hypothetical protein
MFMENEEVKAGETVQANAEETPLIQTGAEVISTNEPNVLDTGLEITTENISTDSNALPVKGHPNDVRFKVKYGKDFKGEKTLEDGSVHVVSKESAEQFSKAGIGSVIK